MEKVRVAIVGATGYAGAELVRLLEFHPSAEISAVTSARNPGKSIQEECPWLTSNLILSEFDPSAIDADVVFLCQEAGFAMQHAAELVNQAKVIDLSADFRLHDVRLYEKYYGRSHDAPDWKAVYGLPELGLRAEIRDSNLVANPGCYPTASILALLPLARAGLNRRDVPAVVDAKSGVSGAGRSKKETDFLFSEMSDSFKAYAPIGHRHTPEIEQAYGSAVRFTPHLLPIARGIHATAHVALKERVDLVELYTEMYRHEPFVHVQATPPSTKQVRGSNMCVIYPIYDDHTGFAVVCSVIDNLVKGAAGQAIQNMNIMMGLPETAGLPRNGLWP